MHAMLNTQKDELMNSEKQTNNVFSSWVSVVDRLTALKTVTRLTHRHPKHHNIQLSDYIYIVCCWLSRTVELNYINNLITSQLCLNVLCVTTTYHSGAETAPLVACETKNNWFQLGGACLQVIVRSCSAIPVGWLSTRHGRGTSTSHIFRRLHVCRPTDTVTEWRQEFLCSQTAAMEQPRGTTFEHYKRLLKAFLFV